MFRGGNQGIGDGGVKAALQKLPTGQHLLPGISRVGGVPPLDGEQIHIALPGDIKAVVFRTDQGAILPAQGFFANRADQVHIIILQWYSIPHFLSAVNESFPLLRLCLTPPQCVEKV